MSKKILILGFALCTLLLALCYPSDAQQAGKVFRIGYLDGGTPSGNAVLLDAFRQGLNKLGWFEGKNLLIEYRFGENKGPERLTQLAESLVALQVDLIASTSTQETLAAKNATASIPIVMTSVGDPVGRGLVASLAKPGGNVTGFGSFSPELITKRLEILKEVMTKLVRVGILRPPETSESPQMKEIRAAASILRLELEEIATQVDTKSLAAAFQAARQKHVGALMTHSNPRFFAERKRIVELAEKHRLPAIYHESAFVDAGGLMAYGIEYDDLHQRAAVYVDKILKGAKPGDLPVQQATKFEFVINLKTARQIDFMIPQKVLARADRVIK